MIGPSIAQASNQQDIPHLHCHGDSAG
uniref:Uncharacterized protein n=1 Tax=Anguilla anguilla TaxID=7936 RepID=A0A0E9VIS7_ANGAN